MQYRSLGTTGIDVSVIGFGAWGIGGRTVGETSYGETDDAVSLAALSCALENGISLYDTSPAYGDGRSETLIGKAFKGKRDRVVIATKLGIQSWTSEPDYSAEAIRRSVDGSLRRLGSDYIDILQFHNAPLDYLGGHPEIIEELEALVQAGKIRAWGMSLKRPDDGVVAIDKYSPSSIQVNINMLDMRAVNTGLTEKAMASGVGLIARTPLCFGFLTQTIERDAVFASGDHRNAWSRAQIHRWLDGADSMLDVVAKSTVEETAAQSALRFCLSVPGVTAVIPGLLTPEEVAINVAAGDMPPLDLNEFTEILNINKKVDFFVPRS